MAMGTWAATAVSAIIVAADEHRGSVVIQLQSAGDPTSLAFGEDAIFGEGLQLISAGDYVQVSGHLARLAVYAICDAGNSSSGGFQTA